MANPLQSLIPQLGGKKILVVGDIILDEYVTGIATRLSREAPVPVLEFEERRYIPGGAANPAANIVALGSKAVQVGIVGEDAAATTLYEVLEAHGIETDAIITCSDRPTTVKTRIMAQMGLRFPQQVARLDTLSRTPINASIEQRIRARISNRISGKGGKYDALLLSDYHIGLLTKSLVDAIRETGQRENVLLAADAQGKLGKYIGFGLVKCNADEARSYLQRDIAGDTDFAAAAQELCEKLELTEAMVVTRGADGATLSTHEGQTVHCPAPTISDVYDTVGAGDTTIAVLTLAIAAGASYVDAVTLANYASGIVVRHVGNHTPTPDELAQAVGV